MKLGDRFKVNGGKVHVVLEWINSATCGAEIWRGYNSVQAERTSAPVTCHHCLRKLAKIKAIALMAGEEK